MPLRYLAFTVALALAIIGFNIWLSDRDSESIRCYGALECFTYRK